MWLKMVQLHVIVAHISLCVYVGILLVFDNISVGFCKVSGESKQQLTSESVCEKCQLGLGIPSYCQMKPYLHQCIRPICPKSCVDTGKDSKVLFNSYSAKLKHSKPYSPPPPVSFPKIDGTLLPKLSGSIGKQHQKGRTMFSKPGRGRTMSSRGNEEPEVFQVYDKASCTFASPHLRRIKPGSKYVEYRPTIHTYEINDIKANAAKYGLVMAEFRNPLEWFSVEKSPVLNTVSKYKMTEDDPRIYYVIGHSDYNSSQLGEFKYDTDKSNVVFSSMDPAIFGKTDERCSVLSHVMDGKKNYLTTRLWDCSNNFSDRTRVAYGLFMFPPDSDCYIKSGEECTALKVHKNGDDKVYSVVEIGQTPERFIYFDSNQRNWLESKQLCESKDLQLLDLDPKWKDATTVVAIIGRFLKTAKLSPSTMFWTSGKFETSWADNKFLWVSTKTFMDTSYANTVPPYQFAWWDDQASVIKEIGHNKQIQRRSNIEKPCVALALNPENGGARPKLKFKAWYCNFPMYPLCYKKVGSPGPMDMPAPPLVKGVVKIPSPNACQKPVNAFSAIKGRQMTTTTDESDGAFNEATCTSKSTAMTRLTPTSKYVLFEPKSTSFSIQQIKEQCIQHKLVPGEIATLEDWNAIINAGIGTLDPAGGATKADYFYVIGMDDSKTKGEIKYNSNDEDITFAMYNPNGKTNVEDQCSIIDAAVAPDNLVSPMMYHENCNTGFMTDSKIAYGLCMFPRSWSCFTDSSEEKDAVGDSLKLTTLIELGVTSKRSLFFNPVQRNWEDAQKVCQAANLQLLDFDPVWNDTKDVLTLFTDRMVRTGGFFQLTPVWTSGKLKGVYTSETGKWATTGSQITFGAEKTVHNIRWLRFRDSNLNVVREGAISDPCVEASMDDVSSEIRLRPDDCDMPKFFLCYRKNKRRTGDPSPKNTQGITIISTK